MREVTNVHMFLSKNYARWLWPGRNGCSRFCAEANELRVSSRCCCCPTNCQIPPSPSTWGSTILQCKTFAGTVNLILYTGTWVGGLPHAVGPALEASSCLHTVHSSALAYLTKQFRKLRFWSNWQFQSIKEWYAGLQMSARQECLCLTQHDRHRIQKLPCFKHRKTNHIAVVGKYDPMLSRNLAKGFFFEKSVLLSSPGKTSTLQMATTSHSRDSWRKWRSRFPKVSMKAFSFSLKSLNMLTCYVASCSKTCFFRAQSQRSEIPRFPDSLISDSGAGRTCWCPSISQSIWEREFEVLRSTYEASSPTHI